MEERSEQQGQGQSNEQQEAARAARLLELMDRADKILDKFGEVVSQAGIHGGAQYLARQQGDHGLEVREVDLAAKLRTVQSHVQQGEDAQADLENNFVLNLGKKWEKDVKRSEGLREQFEKDKAPALMEEIEKAQREGRAADARRMTGELAEILHKFSFKPELKEFGYFDQPKNFEDLIELLASSENPEFQPGGDFALYEVVPVVGEDGRQVWQAYRENRGAEPLYNIKVNYHNFLRWLMDREMYFIGQNPFAEIHLFQDISVPSLNPIPMSYIVNNPKFWISEQWVPHERSIEMTAEEYEEKRDAGEDLGDVIENPEKPGQYLLTITEYVQKRDNPPELRNLQDEVIMSLFLTETEHNMDVAYFTEGMKNEKNLEEYMGKICNTNFLTRFFSLMLNAPSTNELYNQKDAEGNPAGEVISWLKGGLEMARQGRQGKAQQRALAMFYHIAEANAIANGQEFLGGVNPFVEVLRAENGTDMSIYFYKSLMRQAIENNFKNEIVGVKELADLLNERKISIGNNRSRKPYTWEKVDVLDLLFLIKHDLARELAKVGLTLQDLDAAREVLKGRYAELVGKGKMTETEKTSREGQLDKVNWDKSVDGPNERVGPDEPTTTKMYFLQKFADSPAMNMFNNKSIHIIGDKKGDFYDFYKSRGYNGIMNYGIKFFALEFDSGSTPDANIYRNIKYSDTARKRVFRAIADTIVQTDHVDDFEAKYATERSYRRTYFMGISARNDVDAIGHDRLAQITNEGANRVRQGNRAANYYGLEETLSGIERVGVDMFEGINARQETEQGFSRPLYEIVMGARKEGNDLRYNVNDDIGHFEIPGNSMRQYFSDHLVNAIAIHNMLRTADSMDIIGKFMKEDTQGRYVFDHEAFKKFIDGIRKQSHYCFDNAGIQYDKLVGGWTFETYLERDKKTGELVPKTRVIFCARKIKDLMLSKRVREMGMYERPDMGGTPRGTESKQMARNVTAYLIAMQLKAHQKEGHSYWNAQFIGQVVEALRRYGVGVLEMANDEAVFLRGFFTPGELRTILATAEIFLWEIYSREYAEDAMSGFLAGIFESFSIVMGEIGAGISLKAA